MVAVILSLGAIAVFLLWSEWLWRSGRLKGELARKFVHILVGCFIAFWPFYMSYLTIQMLSLALFAVIYFSRRATTLHAIHSVRHHGWGELLFALCIGVAAILEPPDLVFATAILHLALADGLAGIIGTMYGKRPYKIFGEKRTIAGSLAFWLCSVIVVSVGILIGYGSISSQFLPVILWLPLLATFLENAAPMGLDNLIVPLVVIAVLTNL